MSVLDISEFCDEDGVRFTVDESRRRFPGGLVGSQHCAWKSRNNHFVSYNDIVVKGIFAALTAPCFLNRNGK